MATPAQGTADSLYQDPTPAYAPALAEIAAQQTAANQRYAENKADIKNIFGSLSSLSAADSARITQQFTDTIAEQAASTAARTAEARTGLAKGMGQAVATGAERGQGPAMVQSPLEEAVNRGIGTSNAYQTAWEGLLNANKTQAIADTGARQQGYALQEQSALATLNKNLQDRLAALGSQKAGISSDIAKAQMQAKQLVLNTKYDEAQAAKAAQAKAAASASAAANKPKTYAANVIGWSQQVDDTFGVPGASAKLRSLVSKVASEATATLPLLARNQGKTATKADVISRLTRSSQYANDPALPYMIDYINKYSGLK